MICLAGYNLSKSYADSDQTIQVLKNATLEVESGDMIGITGVSGCGKSTLMHILGLLDAPDSGKVMVMGNEISAKMPQAPSIRNRDIGFVFQFHYLVEDLSAAENVALPMLIGGATLAKSIARANELLTRLGLKERRNHYPNQLSGGEQQRIALARALINEPKIVLADEPTGNLDPIHSLEVWKLMQELNKELGQAFVIVTHDRDLAQQSNKTFELARGTLSRI
ncbi:MAG: ABC transporter ATP-binding protein [Candidatus Cloacimonadaceae bacterium]|nr:ABC transporter ATP-binding protein [Candidatus Cloacimonadaceae bacterium]MDP3114666.1 ABC transporter ATP-binding protein [Candidatus Cloacimonadaceae bacterium]